ncbi:hypothetical protein Hanom_Chr08g00686031 [Helianthus anomalus]
MKNAAVRIHLFLLSYLFYVFDPLLAVATLVCGVLIPSAAKGLLHYYTPN